MFSKGKIIYSKRYPHPTVEEMLDMLNDEDEEFGPYDPPPPFEEFIQQYQANHTFVLRPDKLAKLGDFLDVAKEITEDFEIDIDIKEFKYRYEVKLYLAYAVYTDTLKRVFAWLINVCDKFSISQSNLFGTDLILSLEYQTHECYRLDEPETI